MASFLRARAAILIVAATIMASILAAPHSTTATRTYSTTFAATENPISEGGNWVNGAAVSLDWTDMQTAPGKAFGTQLNNSPSHYDDSTALLTGAWGNDQAAQATIYVTTAPSGCCAEAALHLRANLSAHSSTGYELGCSLHTNGSQYIGISRWNGAMGNVTTLGDVGGVGCTNGDVLGGTAVGSTITIYKNGVAQISVTDTMFPSGAPGIGWYLNGSISSQANYGLSNFTANDSGALPGLPTPTPTRTPTVTPTPGAFVPIRVNTGGPAYTDGVGNVWAADNHFTGGTANVTGNTITGTSDQPLYRSERYGTESYSFPVPNGNYTVTLKFAEMYWYNAGQRVFNVLINGSQVLTNFDVVVAAGGRDKALDRTFLTTVTNGMLTINLVTVVDNATISAIQIVSAAPPTATPIPSTATPVPTSTATATPPPTSTPTATSTPTIVPTATATAVPTDTPAPSPTPLPTQTPVPCSLEVFRNGVVTVVTRPIEFCTDQ